MEEISETTQLIARQTTGSGAIPEIVWSPLATAGLVLLVGTLSLICGQPWLFPTLIPSAYLQAALPIQPTSRFYNVLLGQLLGVAAGMTAALLFAAEVEPSILGTQDPQWRRVMATSAAVLITLTAQVLLKAIHPPGAGTAGLITFGGFQTTWEDVGILVTGVVILAIAGEVVRRLRLAQPGQK